MKSDTNQGINKLARTISERIGSQTDTPPVLDFGTIKKNGSLIADSFPVTIAKGDYSVLKGCSLSEGSRVLVAWVESAAVVIGRLDT
ncbi:MAG: hypothetical protein NC489_26530 [Ruminococcus flavefaciens]|nr:hypothetical protein [Ruminococcus flavefaciens]